MKTKETELKDFLVEQLKLNKDKLKRHNGETPVHLRFMTGNGIDTFSNLLDNLTNLNLKYKSAGYKHFSRSPDYADQGLIVEYNGEEVGIQFNVQKEGRIRRKGLTPDSLGLSGKTFSDAESLYNLVKKNISGEEFEDVLLSMLDSVKHSSDVKGIDKIQPQDISRITSDFGEILGAYQSLINKNTVSFPNVSNEPIADYYENDQPVSAKGRKTGGKVNLSHWKTFIDQKTLTGKFLYSIADHNRDDFFQYASMLCPEIKKISDMVGGTSVEKVEKYVSNNTYDSFYNYIKQTEAHKGLGIPDEGRPRELWNQGSTDPFYFTINTLVSRLWGHNAVNEITDVVKSFLKKPKFIAVDIIDNKIVTNEIEFSNVKQWKTAYWSRATKAWHNWMAVEPVKGMKA